VSNVRVPSGSSGAHLLASSEALLAGERFGLAPSVMLDAVNGSSGRSGSTENKWPNFVLPETYDSGFALVALGLAEATGAPTAHTARTVELWADAAAALSSDADHTEIVRWLRDGGSTDREPMTACWSSTCRTRCGSERPPTRSWKCSRSSA
jgi:hypothetical protein